MKKTNSWNRLLSLVLCICMVLSMVPGYALPALAEEAEPTCSCSVKCTEGSVNSGCPVCSAEGADLSGVCTGTEETTVVATFNIDAAAMTPEELKAAVDAALAAGYTAITVNLTEDADATMFSAIAAALAADYVADGTVDLTISGAKTVPEYGFFDNDNYFENDEKNIAGDKLKSLTLTDVETIGDFAFSACTYLESVNLPQVVTIGECAFNEWKKGTKLTSLNLPNATTIGDWAFAYSSLLTSVNLPKVVTIGTVAFADCDLRTLDLPEATTIGGEAFYNNENLVSCSAPKATTIDYYPWGKCSKLEALELTAAGNFTIGNNIFELDTPTEQIDLVLHKDKESQVTQNDDGTAIWKCKVSNGGYNSNTFKSITTVHIPAADDGDCTTAVKCTTCGETVVEAKESHTGGTATCTTQAVCETCGTSYGEADPNNHDFSTVDDNGKCGCGVTFVAAVDKTVYSTFADAVANWTDGATLTLFADVTGKSTINISGKSVTFDMNGHTYSMSSWMFKVEEGASLVITDSSSEGNGLLNYTGSGGWAIISRGNLTFAGGKATSVAYDQTVCISAGTFRMTGGTVENTGGTNALLINGYQDRVTSVLISGGTFSGKTDDICVYDSPMIISGTVYFDSIVIDSQYYDTYQSVANFKDAENADGWKIHSQYCPLTVGTQLILPDNMELQVDTLPVTVLNPGYVGVISHPHSGGNATCGAQAICDICSKPYGTTPAHSFDETGKCSGCGQQATISVTDGTNTYYALDAVSLNTAVTDLLNTGARTFTVNLPATAEAKLFTAIRRALIDTEGVADGSINLTLAGVTAIPDHDDRSPSTAIFGDILGTELESVTQLAAINLPDVLTIGDDAFKGCENLLSLTAPKVQTVGDWAFAYTGITELELPEATTLGWVAFCPCENLTSVKLPKAVSLGQQAFDNCESLTKVELTAEGDITFSKHVFENAGNIDLVLNFDKVEEVTNGVTWKGYTFKSITFVHADGTTNHSFTHTPNEDSETHKKIWSDCGYVEIAAEAHTGGTATCTEKAVCDLCGASYGELDPYNHADVTAVFEWPDSYSDYMEVYVRLNCVCGEEVDYFWVYGDAITVETLPGTDCKNPTVATCTLNDEYNGVTYTDTKTYIVPGDPHAGEFVNGFCSACGGFEEAVWNEEDYVYEIYNAGQLYWYAQELNTNNSEIYVKLMKDIVIPENAPNWEPINASYAYFNGNFHTISGLKCIGGDAQYVGLFGMEGWWYEISNLHIDGSYFEGSGYVGAVVACMTNGGSITNCAVTNTTVQGDGDSVGTLAGYLSVGSVVNCFVDANTLAGGYTNGYATIENSYYLSETETEDGGKTAEQFASGEVAYLLQSGIAEEDIYDEDWNWIGSEQPHVWGQTVGQDAYPVLKGQKVYENLDCAGAVAGYANEIIIQEHSFVQGYCQVCGEPLGDAVLDGVTYVFGGVIPLRWYLNRVEVPTYWVAGDGYVYFDPAAKLLTLDNATVYSELWSSEDSAVYWEDDLVINFSGTNTMSANDHNNGIVILVKGAAVMNGIGKDAVLHINSGADEAARFGSLTVNSGTVSFVSKDSAHTSAGVSTVALTVAEGAVVNVTAGNANSEYGLSYGMAAEKLHVDGTLNASYGSCVNERQPWSCGVICTELTGSGTINALMLQLDQENMILNFTACGKAVLASNWKATTDEGFTVTNIFTVAEGAILTIPEGVTLDLTEADFTFAGTVINHGIILLPADFALDDAPKSGTIRIGEKGYVYDSVDGKWYCTEDGHIGGTATCTARAVCETCGASYGELDPANHDKTVSFDDNGFCPGGCYEPATLNADGYYEISNAGQLYWFAAKLSYGDGTLNGILTADIVVNQGTMTAETTGARAWIRIMARYKGTFDGNNKTISGLYFNDRDATYAGLFSFNQGTVKNVGVINSYFGANEYVGSIAGYNSGTVTNCYSTGAVSGSNNVGGVVGNNDGTVTNCYNTGAVGGSNNVGGVVGYNDGPVTNCYNTGSVNGNNDVGGVMGNNTEIVTNCYNTGSVTGSNNVGGVVGNNTATVTNCYNTGSVSGNEKVGGVAGYNDNSITDCYSIGSVSGTGFHIGGVVGYCEFGTMTNCYNTGAVSGSYNVGSVVGDYNFLTLKNCYYLSGCATDGSGVTQFGVGHEEMGSTTADDPGCVDAKTATQFASGEVAYLLGEAFGQTISADDHPILGGKKVYQVTNCKGETAYSNTEENGAHTEQTVTGKAPTCTEPGLTDGMICSVCGEMLVAQKVIPATGHSYDSDVCTVCGHIGVPVKLDSASLSFKEKIHYNIFFYLGVGQTVELADMGLILFDSLNADGTVDDAIATYSGAVQMDGKYMVATDGIHAKRMGDTIYFRVYAKLADGSYVYSKTVEYSAVTYAQHILKGNYSDSDKALVVAMLNYGAQAQRYFGYNTENPVNAGLTEEQQALVKGYESDLLVPVQKPDSSKTGAFASTGTGFAKKAPAVSFEGSFLLNYFFTPSETVAGDMTLYYWTEADYAAATELTAENATGSIVMTPGAQYHGVLDGIYAKDADATVYVAAVYSDGTATHCTGILPYSIGAYLTSHAAKETNFRAMAQAAAVYCSYCKEYFKG